MPLADTPKLGLHKPDTTDPIDVAVLNQNWDTLDQKVNSATVISPIPSSGDNPTTYPLGFSTFYINSTQMSNDSGWKAGGPTTTPTAAVVGTWMAYNGQSMQWWIRAGGTDEEAYFRYGSSAGWLYWQKVAGQDLLIMSATAQLTLTDGTWLKCTGGFAPDLSKGYSIAYSNGTVVFKERGVYQIDTMCRLNASTGCISAQMGIGISSGSGAEGFFTVSTNPGNSTVILTGTFLRSVAANDVIAMFAVATHSPVNNTKTVDNRRITVRKVAENY